MALGLTAVVAHGYPDLSVFAVNMLTGMGLALGIDYALFVVSRFREERAHGREKPDAIGVAGATASRAVLFSGTAFILAMTGLLLVQSTIMRSLAIGAILVGVVSIVAALTLLPAILGLLGDRVNGCACPGSGAKSTARRESRFWTGRRPTRVIHRPVLSLAAAVVVLLAAASPLLGMKIGAAGISTLPDSFVSKRGFLALERSFPTAGAYPAQVVIVGKVASPKIRDGIARLRRELAADQDFGRPNLTSEPSRDIALLSVPVAADAAERPRRRCRDEAPLRLHPACLRRLGCRGARRRHDGREHRLLRGDAPLAAARPRVRPRPELRAPDAWSSARSFSLRPRSRSTCSRWAPPTACSCSSSSTASAAGLFGFQQIDTIEAWVPLFLFAVLFGLSMDYQVFLLSRIRERYAGPATRRTRSSSAIGSTARIITGAALIIVAVFAGFAAGDLVMFQQMGFGIAVALLIDATIVRSVLVPAVDEAARRRELVPAALARLAPPRRGRKRPETRVTWTTRTRRDDGLEA